MTDPQVDDVLTQAANNARIAAEAASVLSEQIEKVQQDRRNDKKVYVAMLATILLSVLIGAGTLVIGGSLYANDISRRLGDPTGPVNTVVVLTASCAQEFEGDEEILACVQLKLEQRRR